MYIRKSLGARLVSKSVASIFFVCAAMSSVSAAEIAQIVRPALIDGIGAVVTGYVVHSPDTVYVGKIKLPRYAQELIKRGVQGVIKVHAKVDTDGHVSEAEICASDSTDLLALGDSVLDSVRQATFYRASTSVDAGQHDATEIILPFRFQIAERIISVFPFKRVAK